MIGIVGYVYYFLRANKVLTDRQFKVLVGVVIFTSLFYLIPLVWISWLTYQDHQDEGRGPTIFVDWLQWYWADLDDMWGLVLECCVHFWLFAGLFGLHYVIFRIHQT